MNKIKNTSEPERICPKCGERYTQPPAHSRINGEAICSDCGTREALDSLGVSEAEQKRILDTIHRFINT